ncbi:MAG TPA: DUF1737 domain-containing protein [Pyrinomonadaceae bacterium]|nr:DUF1737 domain-containing protein [Pyrinomonadaceae bacterium]
MEYELILSGGYMDEVETFNKRITEKLADGWKLYGPTIIAQSPTPNDDGHPQTDLTYAQAVIRDDTDGFVGVMPG